MAAFESTITGNEAALTNTNRRDVLDNIPTLFPNNGFVTSLVAKGPVDTTGLKRAPLNISKREVKNTKYECFLYPPLEIDVAVTVDNGSYDFTVDSVDGLHPKLTIYNTATGQFGRITSVTTGTSRIVVKPVTADFTVTVGDVLILSAAVYAENSSSPYMAVNDEEQVYNYTAIIRHAISMSGTAMNQDNYGGDRWKRKKKEALLEGMRKLENLYLTSERPSSTYTTTDSTIGDSFRTFRGLLAWKDSDYDAKGGMTHELFMNEMALSFDETVDSGKTIMGLVSQNEYAYMLQWVQDKLMVMQEGSELKQYGVKTTRFLTSRCPIEVMVHDVYNRGSMLKKAAFFDPEKIEFVYLSGRNLRINTEIQGNDVDGKTDELFGEIGFSTLDGGRSIMTVSNWY